MGHRHGKQIRRGRSGLPVPAVDTRAIKGRRTFCDVNKNREITAEGF